MATLYVENVPDDLTPKRSANCARRPAPFHRRRSNSVARTERSPHRKVYAQFPEKGFRRVVEIAVCATPLPGPFPSSEEMIREDRER